MKKYKTLRDLIGDIKNTEHKDGYLITETNNGCFTNLNFKDDYINWLDAEVNVYDNCYGQQSTGLLILNDLEGNSIELNYYKNNKKFEILSIYPGDPRGAYLFGDTFISSGHDGNYLWNIKTKEFKSNHW